MPNFKDFYFNSSTGQNRIRVRQCTPDTAPKAIVQIAHGIAEHIERYDDFMSFLAENGFVAVGNDHLGHGKSIEKDGDKGFFAAKDGWNYVVKDMDILHDMMHEAYPDLPYIFFGHSMGSFLTRTYIIEHPEKPDLVILSGTGQQAPAIVGAGLLMANLAVKMYGPHRIGSGLNNIAFGSYNKCFSPARTAYDWLSRDKDVVDKYLFDPLCGFICTVSLYRDMMAGIKFISDQKNADRMDKDTPVYFMSGAMDPVGENGAGVERAYKSFCDAGLRDVFMRLYPDGRHEMLNELNRADVYNDILAWIIEKLEKIA